MAADRVLITGAAGFIGRWSAPPLAAAGYEVHAVVTGTARRQLPAQLAGATVHTADLLDSQAAEALIAAVRPTHLLHFAWIATPGLYWTSAANFRWLDASRRLLQAFHANGGRRAVMAGTCAEYDWARAGLCHESGSPLAQGALAPYAECKLALQRDLARFGREAPLSTAWGRVFFQYGPAEHRDRLVSSVIINLLSGQAALCSHGRQVRSFLHVADVGGAFAALVQSAVEGPVNVGSGEPVTIGDTLRFIASYLDREDLLRLGARSAAAAEPATLLPDIRQLTSEVGWRPRFDLHAGLTDTIEWWRAELKPVTRAGP